MEKQWVARANRDEAFDIAKGIGIIAVVGLHLTSRSAGLFHERLSTGWWVLTWLNRFLNFCVPLFLLVSAILLARSVSNRKSLIDNRKSDGASPPPSKTGDYSPSGFESTTTPRDVPAPAKDRRLQPTTAQGEVPEQASLPTGPVASAEVLGRDGQATGDGLATWGRFYVRRLRSVLLPLVVWSVIYWLMRAFIQHDSRVLGPGFWFDFKDRLRELAFGKAEFHLYFLSVLAQFCLLLPFLVLLFKRVRTNIWVALIIAISCQEAAHWLHKLVPFDWPGSTVFWYLATLIPGVWVGMNWGQWPAVRRQAWPVFALLAAVGFGFFAYESRLDILKLSPSSTIMDSANFAYHLGMSFVVFSLVSIWVGRSGRESSAPGVAKEGGPSAPEVSLTLETVGGARVLGRDGHATDAPWASPAKDRRLQVGGSGLWARMAFGVRGMLKGLGEMSLQIYLMHLILLQLLCKPVFLNVFKALPVPSLWLYLCTLFGTYGVALVMDKVPFVNVVLFGREPART